MFRLLWEISRKSCHDWTLISLPDVFHVQKRSKLLHIEVCLTACRILTAIELKPHPSVHDSVALESSKLNSLP